jgi:M6 family metalloprotease-like protein
MALVVVGLTATWASGPAAADERRVGPLGYYHDVFGGDSRARSVSVNPGPYQVTQPDGTRITLVAWGDAHTHGYATLSGHAVVKDASGVWRYAVYMDATGRPVASSQEVGKAAPPAAARTLHQQVTAQAQASRTHAPGSPGTGQGKQPALVILVSFTNQAPIGSTEATWAEQFFGPGKSVAAYYRQNSFNAFRLVPAPETSGTNGNGVVGWLELPYAHPDFKGDTSADFKLGRDALKAANPYVDYRSFDKDRDGVLKLSELRVTIVVAGYDTSYSGEDNVCGPSVWAHQGGLYESAPKLDGTVVNYDGGTMRGEWFCSNSAPPGHLSTLGVAVGIIGFDIGLPPLFDIDNTSSGVGIWSMMGEGSWNKVGTEFSGSTPAGLDAFSKSYQGWITPTPVSGPLDGAALAASATSPTAYRLLDNPGGVDWMYGSHRGKGEYFLVENRQLVGFDAGLPACGVIVYHIDEGVTPYSNPNAHDGHRLVDVVEASGGQPLNADTYNGSAEDVFPGSSGHLDFNDTTSPAAKLYSGKPSGISMHVNGGCASTTTANFYAPIPNDAFASAFLLEGTEGSVTGGNTTATKQAGEPAVAGDPGGASIWYRFKPPATGKLELSTKGSTFDTLLGVYRGASVSSLKKVATNDNANKSRAWSAVTVEVERGKTYYVAIDGRRIDGVADQGTAELSYGFRPANDNLRHGIVLTGAQGKLVSSNEGAGLEDKEPLKIADQKAGQSIWYTFKAAKSGALLLDLSGSSFDTLLSVSIGTKVSKLRRVADDDNHGSGQSSQLSLRIAKGTTYRIAVAGVEEAAGKVVLRWHV